MAKIQENSILQGIRGSLGDLVIRQMRDGSVQVSIKPAKNQRKFSKEQRGYQDRFKSAVAYAREARTEPVYAELAQETGRSAYHLALSDSLNPPVIHKIERKDGRVIVTASDDVMVTRVVVSILEWLCQSALLWLLRRDPPLPLAHSPAKLAASHRAAN